MIELVDDGRSRLAVELERGDASPAVIKVIGIGAAAATPSTG